MSELELGIIGNGGIAALIDVRGRVVWKCLPRLDGDPVYNAILGGEGVFAIELDGFRASRQEYFTNTAVLRTELEGADGARLEIIDFAPRFKTRGRTFRPMSHVRRVRPLAGQPRITVRLRPMADWGRRRMSAVRGVSHVCFRDDAVEFRVTTDAPLSYVLDETAFVLDRELNFIAGPDESLTDSVETTARDWEEHTADYWRHWVRRLALPLDWQEAVIRAAITLKACVYEETGGIVAAVTSSIPEHAESSRNWDYRYCWLRDAYFTVSALNRLSAVGTLEHYLGYLGNVVASAAGGRIQPVYGVGLEARLTEDVVDTLPGYRDMGPVRRGNQAAEHAQHDVYGHVILAYAQAFFDRRLLRPAGASEYESLEGVGEQAFALHDKPDAGMWEYRTRSKVHTSSAVMAWAGCDRLSKIAIHLGRADRAAFWRERADRAKAAILDRSWNKKRGAFTGAFGDGALDASVLLMAEVGFLPPDDPRFMATVEAVNRDLRCGDHILRYAEPDDFGAPQTAFNACTFWHIDALARVGRREEAQDMFRAVLNCRTRLGLLSEDVDPDTGELWGNFPQTYSMVGVINAAARLSRPWSDTV